MIIRGKVWVFPDNVDTDVITPGKYLDNPRELLKHVLEPLDRTFPKEAKPGDLIVAGKNFGCGSSRESAPEILQQMKIGGIIAESFARIFYRNSIAIGFPILECSNVKDEFKRGDEAEINLETGEVKNLTTGKVLAGEPLPEELLSIIRGKGLLSMLRSEWKKK
jgi:3-isopropylmalate/(R)-2-methylmalate dehydratase small subunit